MIMASERKDKAVVSGNGQKVQKPTLGELPHLGEKFPRVDIIDRDAEVEVRAELPGVEKKDLDVSLSDNTVTLKGSTRHEEKEEKGDYYRSEITTGSFARTLTLPGNVDSDRAKATFRDGILVLTVPKVEQSKRHTVPVE
jgi:HSP20 family protein